MTKNKLLILLVLYLGFVSLGLPDQVLGIAWPSMRQFFNKPLDWAGILVFITAILTAVSGFSSGYFIRRYSISAILITSGLLTAGGLSGYAFCQTSLFLILATIPLGIGAGTIDASLNDYVAQNYSPKHMNWLHGCWGIGATLGPAIMTFSLGHHLGWRIGYGIIAALQLGLVIIFIATNSYWKRNKANQPANNNVPQKIHKAAAYLSVSLFFIYTTCESSIGLWFFSVLTEYRHISIDTAGKFIVCYWAFLTFGRFGVGLFANRLGNRKVLFYSFLGSVAGLLMLLSEEKVVILTGLCLTGFSFSGIYPSMMHETPKRFGSKTGAYLTGFQAGAASLVVALLTPLIGVFISSAGMAFFIPALLFLTLLMIILNKKLNELT